MGVNKKVCEALILFAKQHELIQICLNHLIHGM